MFGKKEATKEEIPLPATTRIDTIPTAFYGGADPLIYQNKENTSASLSLTAPKVIPAPAPIPPRPVAPAAIRPPSAPKPLVHPNKATLLQPPSLPHKKPVVLWVILAVFGLSILLGLGYYFFSSKAPVLPDPVPPSKPSLPVVIAPLVPTTTPSTTLSIVTTTPTPTTTPASRGGGALILPKTMFYLSPDNDSDTLTNAEEEVFQTDPEVADTDKDGYMDALEIANLYNPKGIAPQKIIDSGLAKEYINPLWQYRMYYPGTWRVDAVDNKYDDILLSGSSGDYIEIRVFKKDSAQTFSNWFATNLIGQSYSGFNPLENRFKVSGFKRNDAQVGFFVTDAAVYSIVYFYGEEGNNLFPHVMDLVIQSFRPGKTPVELPDQPVLPGVVSSSPTSSISISSSTLQMSTSTVSSTPVTSVSTTTSSSIPVAEDIDSSI